MNAKIIIKKAGPALHFAAGIHAAAAAAVRAGEQMRMLRDALNESRPHPGVAGINRRAKVVRR